MYDSLTPVFIKAKHYLSCLKRSLEQKLGLGTAAGVLIIILLLTASPAPTQTASNPSQPLRIAIRLIKPDAFEENGQIIGFSADIGRGILEQLPRKAVVTTYANVSEILNAIRLGQADLGIAAIAVTSQREKEFDFSYPILFQGQQIMVPAPAQQTKQAEQELLRRLLEPNLLRLFSIVVLLMLIPAHIVWYFESHNKDGLVSNQSYIPGIFQALWWSILALFGQADGMPKGPIGKIVGLFWVFIGIVFVSYFSAVITSELTIQELQGNIHGLKDLQNHRVAVIADSEAIDYLQQRNIEQVIKFSQDKQAYQALLAGEVDAFVAPSPLLLFYASRESQGRVQIVGEPFLTRFYAIVMPKDSPYRKPINQAILTLKENGTYGDIYQKWFGARPDP